MLGMLRNLARRKKFSQEYINRLTDTKEHESEKATEIKPLSTTDKVESLFGQTQRKKEKNEKSNWIFLFFFSLHGSPRRII